LNGVGFDAKIVFFSKLVFAAQEQGNRESSAAYGKLDPVQSVKEIVQPRVARSPNAGKEM
jgi:hypothetical protein